MCHPKGRSAAKDARSALTRRPARSYSAPTIPATVRHARRRSGERHERSIPRPPALPAPLADPPIAPQPTHTRLRRALLLRHHSSSPFREPTRTTAVLTFAIRRIRGREAMTESTSARSARGTVVACSRRVLEGPVVRLDGGLLAAPLTDTTRTGEGLGPGAQVDGVAVVEPWRVR